MPRATSWVSTVCLFLALVLVLGACGQAAPSPTAAPKAASPAAPTQPAAAPAPTQAPAAAAKPAAKPLPTIMSWTAYDVGSSGYVQSAAVGEAFKKAKGVTLRIVPAGNDVARLAPVRGRTVDLAQTGASAYYASEGLAEFASTDWGPQPLRLVWQSFPDTGSTLVTTKASGAKVPADLKGKKVAFVLGSPALNVQAEALLAFANLTWNDVQRVEMPSYSAALRGLIEGTVEAAYSLSDAALLFELEASPRGIEYIQLDPNDKAGWARLQKIAPYIIPWKSGTGAGLKPDKPLDLAAYPYPVLIAYADKDEDFVYQTAKLLHETFDLYKGTSPSMPGWDVKRASVPSMVPYHPGAVRYLKEIGWWKAEYDDISAKHVKRIDTLRAAFDAALTEASEKKIATKDFEALWLAKRKAALGE